VVDADVICFDWMHQALEHLDLGFDCEFVPTYILAPYFREHFEHLRI